MVYYKPVKNIFDIFVFIKVIIAVVIYYNSLLNSIMIIRGFFFTSKFWFLLCYFLDIKQKFFTIFYPQING